MLKDDTVLVYIDITAITSQVFDIWICCCIQNVSQSITKNTTYLNKLRETLTDQKNWPNPKCNNTTFLKFIFALIFNHWWQIERVEEWLQHRSAHYAWWRKSDPDGTQFDRQCCPKDPVKDSNGIKTRPKQQRCVLWIEFAGRPVNRIGQSAISVAGRRKHSIRIDQQPLGGATAVVFAADLHVGGKLMSLWLCAILQWALGQLFFELNGNFYN